MQKKIKKSVDKEIQIWYTNKAVAVSGRKYQSYIGFMVFDDLYDLKINQSIQKNPWQTNIKLI